MAFAYAITQTIPLRDAHGMEGPMVMVTGTYSNGGGDSGGAIDTGLALLYYGEANCGLSQSATANLVSINDASDGSMTITTVVDEDGEWMAIGKGYA
jgi:hypothetical protein